MLQQRDSHTFIFFIELPLIGWLAGMLREGHNYTEGAPRLPNLPGLPGQRPSGWAAGVHVQCFCLLESAVKIEPYSVKYILVHNPLVFPQLFIYLKNHSEEVTGDSNSSILD